MRTQALTSLLAVTLLPIFAWSVQPCDNNCILQKGAATVSAKIKDYEKSVNNPQDTSCPADGSVTYDSMASGRGSISQSEATVEALITSIAGQYEALKLENMRCGTCRQTNVVSIYSTSVPVNTRYNSACEGMPTTVIEKEFDHRVQIASYLMQTLKGSTQDGQYLQNQCPDPCSYYITSARTPIAQDRERLTLAVQCGQPRAGFILSAPYDYKVGVVQSWTCNK